MSLAASETEDWAGDSDPAHIPSLEPIDTIAGIDTKVFRVLSKTVKELDLGCAPPEEPKCRRLGEWYLPERRQAPPASALP